MLAGFGFTPAQASRLTRLIRWPQMSQEEFDRRELNNLLDELTEIVFSPVRKSGESWIECLQWLLMTDGFEFYSLLTCEEATPALNYLDGYARLDTAEELTTNVMWARNKSPEKA